MSWGAPEGRKQPLELGVETQGLFPAVGGQVGAVGVDSQLGAGNVHPSPVNNQSS